MNILLVEPDYETKLVPLGLMRISTYHKQRGDKVWFIKGTQRQLKDPDVIYITSLFTYQYPIVKKTVKYYCHEYPKAKVMVGGILASLHPEKFPDVKVHKGLWNAVEKHPPDYSLFPDIDYSLTFTCYDDKTEILTNNGFKFFKDIVHNDKVATLNPITKKLQYHYPTNIIKKRYVGELIKIKNTYVDLLVTPNHNLYINRINQGWKLEPVINIAGKCDIKFKKWCYWDGKEKKNIDINGSVFKMDDWLEFFGYYISEGNVYHNKKNHSWLIKISQSKKSKYYNYMKQCLLRLNFNFYEINEKKRPDVGGFVISKKSLYNYLVKFGKSFQKYIPKEYKELSKRQLTILLEALLKGDGHIYYYKKKRGFAYITSSKRLIDDTQEILLKIGIAGDPKCYQKAGTKTYFKRDKRFITANNDIYQINSNNHNKEPILRNSKRKRQMNVENYNGFVYCVDVPNHIIYVRRNNKGVWCGNSRGCINKCAFCLTPDTNILMANMNVKLLKDIKVNDMIMGFEKRKVKEKWRWYFKKTQVLGKIVNKQNAYKIIFSDGRSVVCSADHRWLTTRGWKYTLNSLGKDRSHLTNKNNVHCIPQLDKHSFTVDYMKGYIAGIFLGDGTFGIRYDKRIGKAKTSPYIRLALIDFDALNRAEKFLNILGFKNIHKRKFNNYHYDGAKDMKCIGSNRWDNYYLLLSLMGSTKKNKEFKRGYLSGFFDAEGSFSKCLRISNKNKYLLRFYMDCLKVFDFKYILETLKKGMFNIRISGGLKEYIRFFNLVLPAIYRKRDITNFRFCTGSLNIKKIIKLKKKTMIDIQTDTETFFANGITSHNCCVWRMEPSFKSMDWTKDINPQKKHIVILDNNWLAKPWKELVEDVQNLKDFKKNYKVNNVDFNQSLDCRLFEEKHAKLLYGVPIRPMRFSFDGMHQDKHIQRAIKYAKKYHFAKIRVDVLFNFMDTPEDFYYRLKELCRLQVAAIPMKYAPLENFDRNYVGKHWTKKMLSGFGRLRRAFVFPRNVKEFEYYLGKDGKEFKRLISYKDIGRLAQLKMNKIKRTVANKKWKSGTGRRKNADRQ